VLQSGVEFRRLKHAAEDAVARSLEGGETNQITPAALQQALQNEQLEIAVDADTVRRLQDPGAILAVKQVMGGPGRQAMAVELAQLDAFVVTERQRWQRRRAALQARYDQCR